MNDTPEHPPEPDAGSTAIAADEAPAKPARKRRAPKAAEVVTELVVVEQAPPPEAVAAEAKPKRRRAPARKSAAGEIAPEGPLAGTVAEQAPESVPQAVAPASPAVAARRDDDTRAGDERAEAGVAAAAAAPVAAAADLVPADVGEGSVPGDASGAEAGADDAGQGDPSRRRSRRDRRRGRGEGRADGPADGREDEPGAASAPVHGAPAAPVVDAGEVFAQVLAGEFDAEAEAPVEDVAEEVVHKRVLAPDPDAPKLQKVLAQSGIGSRRDMEEMILDGRITVNGEPAHVGQRISFGDKIEVEGKPVRVRIVLPPPRIIAYHKPVGEVVTHDDPQNRPTVFRRLPRLQQGKWQSVGRLDINTEGLLLFTNSGELANQLMHPRFGVEREYAVRVLGTLDETAKAKLLEGVDIEGQKAAFKSIADGGGEGANHWYRVVITEGRNREVRKLFDAVGLAVSRLIRIRYGTVVLPRGLKRGVWTDLDENDVRTIRRLAGGGGAPREQRQGEARGGQERPPQKPRNDRQGPPPQQGRGGDRGRGNGPGRPRPPEGPPPMARDERPPMDRGDDFDAELDIDPRNIPNPLEQTFDKRFVQNPRSPAGGRGFRSGGGGFGAGGSAPPAPKKGGNPREPDPLQTSVGYIGADAYHRKGNRGGSRGGGGGGGGGGSHGGPRGGNRGGGQRGR